MARSGMNLVDFAAAHVLGRTAVAKAPGVFNTKHDASGTAVRVYKAGDTRSISFLFYTISDISRDFDGAPDSYAPPNHANSWHVKDGLKPREKDLRNATNKKNFTWKDDGSFAFSWAGVKTYYVAPGTAAGTVPANVDYRAFLRGVDIDTKKPGYYPVIADTGFYEPSTAMTDLDGRAIDATTTPYAVLSGTLRDLGVRQGDYGLAVSPLTGLATGFMYCDAAGKHSRGVTEFSAAVAAALGDKGKTSILVFPRTRLIADREKKVDLSTIQPRTVAAMQSRVSVENIADVITRLSSDPHRQARIAAAFARFGSTTAAAFEPAYGTFHNIFAMFGADI